MESNRVRNNVCGDVNEIKGRKIIRQYGKDTRETPNNYLSPWAPGTTFKKNTKKKSTWRNTGYWLKKHFNSTKIALEYAFVKVQVKKHTHDPREEQWKSMNIFVGYIKGKQKNELIIKKPRELMTVSYCDSVYGDCKDTSKITMW